MKPLRRPIKAAVLLAAGWCVTAMGVARADVLEQIPSDALAVLKVNHISGTNTKLSNLMQALGVTDILPPAKDPVNALETQLGLGPGLDNSKDGAAVLLNGSFEDKDRPPGLLLLPVSDYKAFLGSLTVVKTEGNVTTVHFKDNDEKDMYVANWGDYAAIAPVKDSVTAKHDGLKPEGSAAKELAEKDIVIYFNFPVLKTLLLPKIDEGMKAANDQIDTGAEIPENKKKLAHVALTQVCNIGREFLNDCRSVTMGVEFSDAGVAGNMVVDFLPHTYLGDLAGNLKNVETPLLAGLPEAQYLIYGGSVQNTQQSAKLFDDVMGPIMKEFAGLGDDGKKLTEMATVYRDALVSTEYGSAGLIAPTAAIGAGSMVKYVLVAKGDAEKLKTAQAKGSDFTNDIMKMAGQGGTADLLKITVTPEFKTIDGVKFDRVQSEVNPDNTSPEAMAMADQLSKLYGPDGASVLTGVVDSKTMVSGMGLEDDFLGQVVEAAKADKDVMSEKVKLVDAELPKKRALVYYFALDEVIKTGLSYARANGMNVPIQLPNNLPPIGVAAGSEGTTLQVKGFIPTKLTQALFQAGMAAYQQFGGRGGNGL